MLFAGILICQLVKQRCVISGKYVTTIGNNDRNNFSPSFYLCFTGTDNFAIYNILGIFNLAI